MNNFILALTLNLFASVAFAQTESKTESKPETQSEAPKVETPKEEAKVETKELPPKKEEVVEPVKELPAKQTATRVDNRPNKSWNVHVDILAGSYESMGNSSLTFANAGQYPTLTTGEKLPMNVKSGTTGFQFGGGYRLNEWLSWDMNLLILAAKQDSKLTTSTGATHDVTLETGFIYFSPATWTGYPLNFLYIQGGVGLVAEAHRVKTNINNIGNFDTGSFGAGINLGAGVEFPLGKMFTLRGGLTLISSTTTTLEKKINEGQASEVTAKWEERKINIGILSFGTKIYF